MRPVAAASLLAVACAPAPLASMPQHCTAPAPMVLACDVVPDVDPSTVNDRAAFIAAASELVCEWGLRGSTGWELFEQPYCARGFFDVDARREGVVGTPPYDADAGRACLAALLAAPGPSSAFDVATSCRAIALGLDGIPCRPTSPPYCPIGTTCTSGVCHVGRLGERCAWPNTCAIGLWCGPDATCLPSLAIGDPCTAVECGFDLACVDGACAAGMPWSDAGACCTADPDCMRGRCIRGRCAATARHLGCACTADIECPLDVARCVHGVCTARPMPGEACDVAGPPCFGSVCGTGTRCHAGMLGEGPCGANDDCADGLVCTGGLFLPPGHCVAP